MHQLHHSFQLCTFPTPVQNHNARIKSNYIYFRNMIVCHNRCKSQVMITLAYETSDPTLLTVCVSVAILLVVNGYGSTYELKLFTK